MSALSFLSSYASDSDKSDDDSTIVSKVKLPPPNLSGIAVVPNEEHLDDPALHEGRTRSFPHVRGNWTTFVFIKYPESQEIHYIIEKVKKYLDVTLNEPCNICEDIHISLSKTIVLKFHLIDPFTRSLHEVLKKTDSIEVNFSSVKIYCNDEQTRTFVALELDYFSQRSLSKLTEKVDKALLEYNLPLFYEDPSFHMSILWVKGDKRNQILKTLSSLNDIVNQEIGKKLKTITINKINCKSGNKYFQYLLD